MSAKKIFDFSFWIFIFSILFVTLIIIFGIFDVISKYKNEKYCQEFNFSYSRPIMLFDNIVDIESGYIFCCKKTPNKNHIIEENCTAIKKVK